MKHLYITLLAIILQASATPEGSSQPENYEGKGHPTINLERPHVASTDGKDTTWQMWYIAKGTRSEGTHGILTIGGKAVHGTKLHEKRAISGRSFVWCGSWDSRKALFSHTGWLPEDITNWKTTKAEQGSAHQSTTRSGSKPK